MTKEWKGGTCTLLYVCMLISFSIGNAVMPDQQCPPDFIQRFNIDTHQLLCCRRLQQNCLAGYYVHKCEIDRTTDECRKCPEGSWTWEETNSSFREDCIEYSCPFESKMVNFFPTTGCRKPCICDNDRGFYGDDSCNCKVLPDHCKPWKSFSKNCPELQKYDTRKNDSEKLHTMEGPHFSKGITTTSNLTTVSTSNKRTPEHDSIKPKTNSTEKEEILQSNSTTDAVSSSLSFIVIGCSCGILVIFVLFCTYRYRKRRQKHLQGEETETKLLEVAENCVQIEPPRVSSVDSTSEALKRNRENEPSRESSFHCTDETPKGYREKEKQVGVATRISKNLDLKYPEPVANDEAQEPVIVTSGARFG